VSLPLRPDTWRILLDRIEGLGSVAGGLDALILGAQAAFDLTV
jgi:hypothetical protein